MLGQDPLPSHTLQPLLKASIYHQPKNSSCPLSYVLNRPSYHLLIAARTSLLRQSMTSLPPAHSSVKVSANDSWPADDTSSTVGGGNLRLLLLGEIGRETSLISLWGRKGIQNAVKAGRISRTSSGNARPGFRHLWPHLVRRSTLSDHEIRLERRRSRCAYCGPR